MAAKALLDDDNLNIKLSNDLKENEIIHQMSNQEPEQNTSNEESTTRDSKESCCEDQTLYLTDLPAEILLHICSFIHAKFVVCTLSQVCKYMHSVINDNVFWKVRIGKRWPKKYPAIPVSDAEFNWKSACMAREEQFRLWTENGKNTAFFKYQEGIFAPVDAVHLMKNGQLLAAGSRDRYLNVLDVTKLDPCEPQSVKDARVLSKMDAHKGWIWSICSLDNMLATGSWDTKVRFWDMSADGQMVQEVSTKSAILCSHYEPSFFVAGGYDKKVYHIDPRTASHIEAKRYHRQPILCLAVNDSYIVTGSEDKTIVVFDRRANKEMKSMTFAEYPMSLSYRGDELWVGDKLGSVHLVDATDGDFNVVETYDVGHRGKLTSLVSTPGALFTCSTDHTVRVLEPSVNPGLIGCLTQHTADIADICFQNDILASASSDSSIGIWKPKC